LWVIRPRHDAVRRDEAPQQRRIHPRVAGAQRRSPQGIVTEANAACQPLAGEAAVEQLRVSERLVQGYTPISRLQVRPRIRCG
jgi:hypothetical protein